MASSVNPQPNPNNPQTRFGGVSGPATKGKISLPEALSQKQSGSIRFVQTTSAETMGEYAAGLLAQIALDNPKALMILPTGETPKPVYRALRKMTGIDWSGINIGHLDEYDATTGEGLTKKQTYAYYFKKNLLKKNILNHFLMFNSPVGRASFHPVKDYLEKPLAYEDKLRALATQPDGRPDPDGKPEVVMLGIGGNGHIAFIEPPQAGTSEADWRKSVGQIHRVELAESTITTNFPDKSKGYATHAYTLGLDTILNAKKIILIANGDKKKAVLEKALGNPNEPPTPAIPASYLKTHPNVTVITDFPVTTA